MLELLVGIVLILAIACMLSILGYWYQCWQYDKWIEEFNRKGIKMALSEVRQGSEVVGYTLVTERRSNRL